MRHFIIAKLKQYSETGLLIKVIETRSFELRSLKIQNGQVNVYCTNLYGKIHHNEKGKYIPDDYLNVSDANMCIQTHLFQHN